MCVVMVACFTFAWTPYALMALYVTIFSPKHFPPAAAIAPSLFAKASTAYNPIILIIMNQQVGIKILICLGYLLHIVSFGASEMEIYIQIHNTEDLPFVSWVQDTQSKDGMLVVNYSMSK